jgi:translation initiation factor IF-2
MITFLDTPGHEAFTAMRARGAQATDIVILVVAADDGVMPTTKEAYAHAMAAHVPIIVAMNKIDKRNANPEKLKQELNDMGLVPDEWGGTTMVVPVSARDKIGIDDLLEAIVLTTDDAQILANPKAKVVGGTVIESRMEKSKGPLATLLIQNGTLRAGDVVVAGTSIGKLRAMFDENGKQLKEAPPSTPVQVMGLDSVPAAGEMFTTYRTEKEARAVVQTRLANAAAAVVPRPQVTMEDLFKQYQAGEVKELRIILKADVQGSMEPIVNELKTLSVGTIGLKILHAEVGNISENDVNLAISTGAILIGFNVEPDSPARKIAESNGVQIKLYSVIYTMIEDVEKALKGMLDPVYEDKVIGKAEVRQIFSKGKIAGCFVREGEIRRNAKVRVLRGRNVLVQSGTVKALKRMTEDVREVRSGFECGISIDEFENFIPGDVMEFIVTEQ